MTLTTIEDTSACVIAKVPQKVHDLLQNYGFELVEIKDFNQFRYHWHGYIWGSYVHINVGIVEMYGHKPEEKIEDILNWKANLYPLLPPKKNEGNTFTDAEEVLEDDGGNLLDPNEFNGETEEALISCIQEFYK